MTESVLLWALAALVSAVIVVPYAIMFRRRRLLDRERKAEASELGIDRPMAQYPYIDPELCIGCGACVAACPEGDPLGVVGGTAVVINGLRCVGHGRCETACPVGAIEVGLGDLKGRADIPTLTEDFETTVPGVYIAGELGGLALVKNASNQGRDAVRGIVRSLQSGPSSSESLDLVIIGAGPAGIRAAIEAKEQGLSYRLLEREPALGGSLLHYPRRKMVLTQPVHFGDRLELSKSEYSKETLLELLEGVVRDADLQLLLDHAVERVVLEPGGLRVDAGGTAFHTRSVLLCMGRRGTPRKLGVPGEESEKVMYRLIDAAAYEGQKLLVVGGGDSAIEAALGLARERGNEVTISYRKPKFFRIKKKNEEKIEKAIANGKIRAIFGSNVEAIDPESVRLRGDGGEAIDLPNDFVFVFAGGVPPFAFLETIGVGFGGAPPKPVLVESAPQQSQRPA